MTTVMRRRQLLGGLVPLVVGALLVAPAADAGAFEASPGYAGTGQTLLTADSGIESGTLSQYGNSYGSSISTQAFSGNYAGQAGSDGHEGGVAQQVSGLVPGADYVAWAMARSTSSATPVVLGESQFGAPNDAAVSTPATTWTPLTVDFTMGAGKTWASVFCWKGNSPGYGLCDEVNLHRVNRLPLDNGGFESGSLTGWTPSGGSVLDSSQAHQGGSSARLGTTSTAGAVSRQLTGLQPNATYVATTWLRTDGTAAAQLVASGYGAGDQTWSVNSTSWAPARVVFTTGPSSTTATLACTKTAATGAGWCDDVTLRQLIPNTGATAPVSTTVLRAGFLLVGLDGSGKVTSLIDARTGQNWIAPGRSGPLVSLVVDGQKRVPTQLVRTLGTGGGPEVLTFSDPGYGFAVDLQVTVKAGYTTLTVSRVQVPAGADLQSLLWGPLPSSINQTVAESAGLVYNDVFAIGMKPLTDRTEGGWPREYPTDGWQPDVQYNPSQLQVDNLEPWSVAAKTSWGGSLLRAFTVDYTKQRQRKDRAGYTVPIGPIGGATVLGSKIALYGAAPGLVPTVLSTIAQGEGLPYPLQNGQWQKTAQASSQSIFVLGDLNAGNLDTAASLAKAAGIKILYSEGGNGGPWQSTGHYAFDSTVGGSDTAAAAFVARAESLGVHIGAHTLSDFIQGNDPYVTAAVPDSRLAQTGSARLSRPLNPSDTTVYLDGSGPLDNPPPGKILRIGNEFIGFHDFSKVGSEWVVPGVTRAYWRWTPPISPTLPAGTPVTRIVENGYGGAVGGLGIVDEIAARLSTAWNTSGIVATSFDGLESASDSGLGAFGIARLVNSTNTKRRLQDGFITEASRMTSNIWDALTRVSWGEIGTTPWDQLYLNNAYYRANFLPGGLGWIALSGNDSQLSLEQKLARGAGLNAGINFQTTVASLNTGTQAQINQTMNTIKEWETARNLGAFTDVQKGALRDLNRQWHLNVLTPGQRWSLQELNASGQPIGTAQPVTLPTPTLTLAPRTLPTGGVGALYEAVAALSNTPATRRYEVTTGSLPPGLTLNPDTGGLIGTPTSAGDYTFTETARNTGVSDASTQLHLRIDPTLTAPATLDLGRAQVGRSAAQGLTLTNNGPVTVTLVNATVNGTGWSVSGLPAGAQIPPGGTLQATVRFAPTTPGPATGTLLVTGDVAAVQVALTATATSGGLLSAPASLALGGWTVGLAEDATVPISNTGQGPATVASVTVTGAGWLASGLATGTVIPAGGSASVTVTFAPTVVGPASGTLTVTDGDGNTTTTTLTGNAIAAGAFSVTPAGLDVGDVLVGSTTTGQMQANAVGGDVTLTSVSATGPGWSASSLAVHTLIPRGSSAPVTVQFAPTVVGPSTGTVTVTDIAGHTTQATLRGRAWTALMCNANLLGANEVGKNLSNTKLCNANLVAAALTGANLTGSDLTGSDLTAADLTTATLIGTNLTNAILTAANLTRADLTGANLTGANLTGANLTNANLNAAHLTKADLTGADLTGADLTGADLTGADLTNATLTTTTITTGICYTTATRWPAGYNPPASSC